jgi:hypothetical protein
MSTNKIDMFDHIQQDTIMRLLRGESIDGVVSFKKDGSLLCICTYGIDTPQGEFYTKLITEHGTDLAKAVLSICQELGLPFVAILSTQNTLFMSDDIADYMIDAILIGSNIVSQAELDADIQNDLSPVEVFAKHGRAFISKLGTFWERIRDSRPEYMTGGGVSLSFEAICGGRKSSWVRLGKPIGTTHIELAVSYPLSMLDFLGASFNVLVEHTYVPHYALEDVITDIFTQPMWWKISHGREVDDLLISLSMIIRQKITKEEFLAKFPINNNTALPVNAYIDYEGFIFYRLLPNGRVDYSKIKTEEYYRTHKFKDSNVEYLMDLNNSEIARNTFPLIKVIDAFHTALDIKLATVSQKVLEEMTFDDTKATDANVLCPVW